MLSFFYLALHTAIMVLAHIFPDLIGLFLLVSTILVSYTWFKRRIFFLYRAAFYKGLAIMLPLLALAVIAINSNIGSFVLWLLYAVVLLTGYVIPISKYLILRLRLYAHIKRLTSSNKEYRSNVNLWKIIFFGSHAPYNITVEAPEKSVTIGVLGSVSAARYIFGQSTIISQKFGNGKAYMIEDIREIEKFEEDVENIVPSIGPSFLGSKYRCDLPEVPNTDKVLLLLHPNSYIQDGEKVLELGEKIGKYLLVSIKTAFALL